MENVLSMDGSEFKMARVTKVPTDRCGSWQSAPYCRTCGDENRWKCFRRSLFIVLKISFRDLLEFHCSAAIGSGV